MRCAIYQIYIILFLECVSFLDDCMLVVRGQNFCALFFFFGHNKSVLNERGFFV